MSGPRIVFSRFLSANSPKLSPWVAHMDQVIVGMPVVAHPDGADGVTVWHLVSANNRHLARSVELHGSFAEAEASARGVIASRADLVVEPVSQASRGSYGWYALRDDVPVMVCARWYLTPRDQRQSIALALRSLDEAELHAGVRLVHQTNNGERQPLLA